MYLTFHPAFQSPLASDALKPFFPFFKPSKLSQFFAVIHVIAG
jgi:hypothetical protein